ncbi:MAG: diacylglycerol kinase family protein [Propionibacteriaceae bacterium]|nr:diacylglycerol kinase family protein [Propionibacteriaceae bacterium]
MRTRWGLAHVATLVLAAAFAWWTWLTWAGAFAAIDRFSNTPGVSAASARGQILAAIAIVTTPTVLYVVLAGLTFWAARRRLHNLAWAMGLSIPLGWGGNHLAKLIAGRPRPDTALPLITAEGWAYPSSHMTAATIVCVLVIAAMVVTRRRRTMVIIGTALLVVAWWLVFANRWWLRAHWFSDLIAGGFLGGFIAAGALALAGVKVIRFGTRRLGDGTRRAAVIYHPTKVPDLPVFRRQVEGACTQRGWESPLWLETDADVAGTRVARVARKRAVDLVLVAGGDGTLRTVSAELAETGIPLGIMPVGTGNLLARNLGVPLDLADALDVAFDGRPHGIDLVRLRADDAHDEVSLVMAGMGIDARIMSDTNADLKKVVGPAAYAVTALTSLNSPPFRAVLSLDGGAPVERTPTLALIANVGSVQGQIALAPDALPDDGLVDLVLASPARPADWGVMATRVLTRIGDHPGIERTQARRLVIETDEPVPFQIDGDTIGTCRRLDVDIRPGAVLVMVP